MNPEELKKLKQIGEFKPYSKNKTVFVENDEGSAMYIVFKGVFGVYINSISNFPVRVNEIREGSFFGEMSVIDGWARSATIISEDKSEVCVIKKDKFKRLLEEVPSIADSILNTLRERAISTAQAVKASGKEAPDLPASLHEARFDNVSKGMVFLTMLARQIRKMNEILITPNKDQKELNVPEHISKSAKHDNSGQILKLLPDGHIKYNLKETADNTPYLERKKMSCPSCGKRSDATIPMFSALKAERVMPDGRVFYKDFDILRYTNIVCPNCNYADTYKEFNKVKNTEYSIVRFYNEEKFTGYAQENNRTLDEVILSYYLNIKCLERVEFDPLRFANAWIRLYWLYSDQKSAELANQAAEQAYFYYEIFYGFYQGSMTIKDEIQVNITMGELSAFTEDFVQAKECYERFFKLCNDPNDKIFISSLKRFKEIAAKIK
jgi:CRP-like cAMP-binding protein/uncharacterized protein (DUF2225 family)